MEASNLERVRENLVQRAGLDVIVPRPVETMVARRAFAMEYIEVCVGGWMDLMDLCCV